MSSVVREVCMFCQYSRPAGGLVLVLVALWGLDVATWLRRPIGIHGVG